MPNPILSLSGNHINITTPLIRKEAHPTLKPPFSAIPYDKTAHGAEPKSESNNNSSPKPMIINAMSETANDFILMAQNDGAAYFV